MMMCLSKRINATLAIKSMAALALLLGLSPFVQADEVKGTLKSVDTGRSEVTLKGIVKDTTYDVAKDAAIWLDGRAIKFADLKADDRVNLTYVKKGEHMIASTVRGLRLSDEASGTVSETLAEKRELIIKGTIKNTTYELTKDATVWIHGKAASLKDIRADDHVLVTYVHRGDHWMANDVSVYKRK